MISTPLRIILVRDKQVLTLLPVPTRTRWQTVQILWATWWWLRGGA